MYVVVNFKQQDSPGCAIYCRRQELVRNKEHIVMMYLCRAYDEVYRLYHERLGE